MAVRRNMTDRYRRFPWLSDIKGMKSAIGEMRGLGLPKQPPLNTAITPQDDGPVFDEHWFINEIKNKIARHPENRLEYPYSTEPIFDEPLVGFVRGDDPIFQKLKTIIGPHHYTPQEIMAWQAKKSKETAHDKEACYKHVAGSLKYCLKNYHIFIYGCGLCATNVPCESGIPVKQGNAK